MKEKSNQFYVYTVTNSEHLPVWLTLMSWNTADMCYTLIHTHSFLHMLQNITWKGLVNFSCVLQYFVSWEMRNVVMFNALINRIDTEAGRSFRLASLTQNWQIKWSAKYAPYSVALCHCWILRGKYIFHHISLLQAEEYHIILCM